MKNQNSSLKTRLYPVRGKSTEATAGPTLAEQTSNGVYPDKKEEKMSKGEEFRSKGEHLKDIYDRWLSQGQAASVEQKNQVALAYSEHIIGLKKETVRRWAQGDNSARSLVIQAHKEINPCASNLKEFWKAIWEIFPDDYDEEDITFLTGINPCLTLSLLCQLHTGEKKSFLLQTLITT